MHTENGSAPTGPPTIDELVPQIQSQPGDNGLGETFSPRGKAAEISNSPPVNYFQEFLLLLKEVEKKPNADLSELTLMVARHGQRLLHAPLKMLALPQAPDYLSVDYVKHLISNYKSSAHNLSYEDFEAILKRLKFWPRIDTESVAILESKVPNILALEHLSKIAFAFLKLPHLPQRLIKLMYDKCFDPKETLDGKIMAGRFLASVRYLNEDRGVGLEGLMTNDVPLTASQIVDVTYYFLATDPDRALLFFVSRAIRFGDPLPTLTPDRYRAWVAFSDLCNLECSQALRARAMNRVKEPSRDEPSSLENRVEQILNDLTVRGIILGYATQALVYPWRTDFVVLYKDGYKILESDSERFHGNLSCRPGLPPLDDEIRRLHMQKLGIKSVNFVVPSREILEQRAFVAALESLL